ncbi:MAG TPA: hypothetical protein VH025_02105, partial [Solirubrobacteraceae bacterium]|nr:hypothetical protein [Solirubrobacteraceae bacterium]
MSQISELRSGAEALAALAALPGGPELLELAHEAPDAMLVGGAVRDLLLGEVPREFDVTVAAHAPHFAARLVKA